RQRATFAAVAPGPPALGRRLRCQHALAHAGVVAVFAAEALAAAGGPFATELQQGVVGGHEAADVAAAGVLAAAGGIEQAAGGFAQGFAALVGLAAGDLFQAVPVSLAGLVEFGVQGVEAAVAAR